LVVVEVGLVNIMVVAVELEDLDLQILHVCLHLKVLH
jgi:hypothetical protein